MSVNGSQTFTVTNNGNQTITQVNFSFNTPTGISHTANLSNFGGSSSYTSSNFSGVGLSIVPSSSLTFTVDYNYVSGGVEEYRYGQIYLTPVSSAGTGTQQDIQVAVYVDGDGSGFPEPGGGGGGFNPPDGPLQNPV